MTTTAVQEFLGKVETDEALQAELAKALESENDRQAVTDLADSKGYDFTPEELWTEVQRRQAEAEAKQAEGELSDEELEAVAGGEFVVGTVAISVASLAASASAGIGIPKIKW